MVSHCGRGTGSRLGLPTWTSRSILGSTRRPRAATWCTIPGDRIELGPGTVEGLLEFWIANKIAILIDENDIDTDIGIPFSDFELLVLLQDYGHERTDCIIEAGEFIMQGFGDRLGTRCMLTFDTQRLLKELPSRCDGDGCGVSAPGTT